MEEKEIQTELASIRNLMERSSKFISLSGLSGILAGVYALIGAAAAYVILNNGKSLKVRPNLGYTNILMIAVTVLLFSVATGMALSIRKAGKTGQSIWNKTSRALLFHMAVPLVAGGLLTLIFIFRGYYDVAAPSTLIFYGLALISASSYTFTDVKYLGICEIILGLVAACLPGYGLLFWAIGFGVLHIVYGGMMYLKYDR